MQAEPEKTPLAIKLARKIAEEGPITVHDFMDACLYDREHGYYRRKMPLGARGDFITAPEISQMFGELVGLWAGDVWQQMGCPSPFNLIELGPGRGTLMADALRALKAVKGFLEAARIRLVECSQEGRALQKSALGAHEPITSWHETLDDVPPLPSIVIANEFIDCLPVRQLVYDEQANAWRERRVTHQRGAFSFVRAEFAADATPMADAPPADGEIFEVRPAVPKLVDAFAAIARLHPLAALIIDYGYEKPSLGNSVQAARAHGFVDLFDAPGESDVTAHVDFSSLIAEAREKGFNAFGPMPMGAFLLRLGIGARAAQLMSRLPAAEAEALRKGMVRLTSPDQMGVLFKAIVLTSGEGISPAPF